MAAREACLLSAEGPKEYSLAAQSLPLLADHRHVRESVPERLPAE